MAAINISDVIKLIPESKLTPGSVCNDEDEFNVTTDLPQLLAEPLDFPTLDQAILQEDTVCIPVEPGIPQEEVITAQVVRAVCDLGVAAEQITVLLSEGATDRRVAEFKSQLDEVQCSDCQIQVHQAAEPDCLGYLGPSQSGEPISLNARLVHADFVLPIARSKPFGWKSQVDFLYPYFSDVESQKIFFKLNHRNRILLNQEVHRWLGNCFLIAVATRLGMDRTHQLGPIVGSMKLGEANAVAEAMRDELENASESVAKPKCDLVVANFNSSLCITEEEVYEWIAELRELCSGQGTIIVLWNSDYQMPIFVDAGESTAGDDQALDSDGQKVFIASDQQRLNSLGLPQIAKLDEIEKLIERHESVLVLPDFINEFDYHRNQAMEV